MYYINRTPGAYGSYGPPRSGGGGLALPASLLDAYLDSMGFVTLTVTGGAVTALERNEAAYNAYIEQHPPTPEPEPEATTEEILDALLGVEGGLGDE